MEKTVYKLDRSRSLQLQVSDSKWNRVTNNKKGVMNKLVWN